MQTIILTPKHYSRLVKALSILACCVFGFQFLLNSSVLLSPFPGWDSGVFLYFGNGILKGLIPYRDMIDHKGPLIYYTSDVK